MMVTERERYLMIEWAKASAHYESVDQWLSDTIDDVGHTVEMALSHDATTYAINKDKEDK